MLYSAGKDSTKAAKAAVNNMRVVHVQMLLAWHMQTLLGMLWCQAVYLDIRQLATTFGSTVSCQAYVDHPWQDAATRLRNFFGA